MLLLRDYWIEELQMIIRDGRYERLRHLIISELNRALVDAENAAKNEQTLVFESAADDADEWCLLLEELDAAAPEELKRELGVI